MKRPISVALIAAAMLLTGCIDPATENAPAAADVTSPYVGMESRDIKALSDAQVDEYLTGNGMGFALVAELNRYPGPRHALDAAEQLDLTDAQLPQVRALFDQMLADAVALGEQIVEKEAQLDALFADARATEPEVDSLIAGIGDLNAQLRFVHVRTHLEMKKLLTPEQVDQYNAIRGYDDEGGEDHVHQEGMEHGA
jgi:Spy/CpxP family protein refolding chaperone